MIYIVVALKCLYRHQCFHGLLVEKRDNNISLQ